jgi:hypothetical protein
LPTGDIVIDHNNFYNNSKDVTCSQLIVENESPFHFQPVFETDNSYKLAANSALHNLGSDNIIHRNHDGSKNTLGIEGGLFYNTVPTVQASVKSQGSQIILDASGSSDEQTPGEYLQYRWDYNNDGVFDTEFLLNPVHTVSSGELLGETIVCWVFDEHFSMNYVAVPKSSIKIVTEEVSLSLAVEGSSFCSGASVVLQPVVIGEFGADNLFSVELSDADGSFSDATTLEYIYGKGIQESALSLTLPGDLSRGNYRLRMLSTDPPVCSDPVDVISVTPSVIPSVLISADRQEICAGTSVQFTASVQNGGSSPEICWLLNDEEIARGANSFTSGDLRDGDVVKAEVSCDSGCFFPPVIVSNEIAVRVNAMRTLSVEVYTFNLEEPQAGSQIELYAYVENGGDVVMYEWSVNGSVVLGSESSLRVIYELGMIVSVKVSSNGDCLSSNVARGSYSFGTGELGNEELEITHFDVYPNPTRDVFMIDCDAVITEVELLNFTGNVILKQSPGMRNPQISVENYPSGLYLLHIKTEKGRYVRKVIKL